MSNMNWESCKSCRDKNTIDTPRSCFSTLSSMMEGLVLRLHEITVGSVYSISIFWRFVSHRIWYTQWRIATWSHVSGYFRVGRSYSQISHMPIYSNVYTATLWPLYRKCYRLRQSCNLLSFSCAPANLSQPQSKILPQWNLSGVCLWVMAM